PPPRRRAGWIVAALAGVLVLALVATVLLVRAGDQPGEARQAVGRRPATKLPPDPATDLPKLLAKRAKAVTDRDRAAFLATVDRRQKTYYQGQATLFARMRTVPFSDFDYRLNPNDLESAARLKRHYRAQQVQLAPVQVRYRFQGQDASPVLARESFTFVLTGSGWRIAGPGDRRMRGRDDAEIWHSDQVRTARSPRTLIVHHPGHEELAQRLLRVADRAYAQVGAAWTGRWERKAVILVPSDQDEAERLVGARNLSRVAAVASSSVESGSAERVLGNRIVVNTDNVVRYNGLNLQILVTHEMTHVATRSLGDAVPLLLVEGFADWAALKPVGLPFDTTRPALNARVDSGGFDGDLPDDTDFRGGDAAVAYDKGSAFCQWVATIYGTGKLQALYRAFRGSGETNRGELDRGFKSVLGISLQTAERRWAAWVRDQLSDS
ncbi:MAG TPA: hypothetical protein VHS79_23460, partial [Actinomycetes bacterium]|nr:hypothetical protein [Actinomycetes bacterium]